MRPSDPRIRDRLIAIADDLPEEIEQSGPYAEALRYVDEHLARLEARDEAGGGDDAVAAEPTEEVRRARELVSGKVAVMIGGCRRPHAHDALVLRLGLKELRWVSTRPHESLDRVAAEAGRKDVALVLMAIRWSSHGFEEVKRVCGHTGSWYVRLPRGYGVNQVARELVRQVGKAVERG